MAKLIFFSFIWFFTLILSSLFGITFFNFIPNIFFIVALALALYQQSWVGYLIMIIWGVTYDIVVAGIIGVYGFCFFLVYSAANLLNINFILHSRLWTICSFALLYLIMQILFIACNYLFFNINYLPRFFSYVIVHDVLPTVLSTTIIITSGYSINRNFLRKIGKRT